MLQMKHSVGKDGPYSRLATGWITVRAAGESEALPRGAAELSKSTVIPAACPASATQKWKSMKTTHIPLNY